MIYNIHGDNTRVFTLDTGRLNQETYDLIDRTRKQYGIGIDVIFPDFGLVEIMVKEKKVRADRAKELVDAMTGK